MFLLNILLKIHSYFLGLEYKNYTRKFQQRF